MRLTKNQSMLNWLIFIMLDFYLVVDSLTGILMHSSGISLSIPYKLFLIALMCFAAFAFHIDFSISIFLSISWLCLSALFFVFENYRLLSFAIQTYMKFFSNLAFYLYFSSLAKFDWFDCRVFKMLKINAVVFFLNIFFGILGFGYSTYGSGVGVKGFFYAGNEIFLILLSVVTIFLIHRKAGAFWLYMVSLFFAILIGTKTALLALFMIIFFDIFFHLSKRRRFLFFLFAPLSIVLIVFVFWQQISKIEIVSAALWKFNKTKEISGSILNALLSNRLIFLENNMRMWQENLTPLNFIFGGNYYANNKSVEIDFFDALILNGGITAICVFCFFIFFIIRAARRKNRLLVIFNLLVLGISFSAGHIWANLTGGIFFIIANVYGAKSNFSEKYSEDFLGGFKWIFKLA